MSAVNFTTDPFPNIWNESFSQSVIDSLKLTAAKRFHKFRLPETIEEWKNKRQELYEKFADAMCLEVDHSLPLDLDVTEKIKMDGYTIWKLSFCTAPGRYATGNLYVPDGDGPFPAILTPHGHHPTGKIAAAVQKRCQIFAKCGYVCLVIDVFGTGERATEHPSSEYHGMYLGSSLFNVGLTQMGVQVADNIRAVDLLQSLPFVDPENIGATGASGGGNHTMYLTAMDDRIKAGASVCSVGSYESYIGSSNCFCELVPNGLTFSEESGLIALIAPRAFAMFNAINDSPCFSVQQMLRTYTEARKVFQAYGVDDHLTCQAFPGTHGYWSPMIEATVGFFDLHLKGIGRGASRAVPDCKTLPESDLLVYPAGERPEKVKSLKQYSHEKAESLRSGRIHSAESFMKLKELFSRKKLSLREVTPIPETMGWKRFSIDAGSSIMIPILFKQGTSNKCRILASDISKHKLAGSRIFQEAEESDDSILIFEPYASGEMYHQQFSLMSPYDYHHIVHSCEWLGFSLFGVWVQEFLLLADWAVQEFGAESVILGGLRDAGIAAVCASLFCESISNVFAERSVTTFDFCGEVRTSDAATLALVVPGILKYADLADCISMSQAEIKLYSPVHGDNTPMTEQEIAEFNSACC